MRLRSYLLAASLLVAAPALAAAPKFAPWGVDLSAADAKSGKLLWSFPANQPWKASPMTYTAGGKQFIAVAAGSSIITFGVK